MKKMERLIINGHEYVYAKPVKTSRGQAQMYSHVGSSHALYITGDKVNMVAYDDYALMKDSKE